MPWILERHALSDVVDLQGSPWTAAEKGQWAKKWRQQGPGLDRTVEWEQAGPGKSSDALELSTVAQYLCSLSSTGTYGSSASSQDQTKPWGEDGNAR